MNTKWKHSLLHTGVWIFCTPLFAHEQHVPTIRSTNHLMAMSLFPGVNKHKEIVQRLFSEALNKQNLALLPQFISEAYTGPNGEKGPEGFKATIQPLLQAFPDIQWTVNDLIEEKDKVVVRWTWVGTQTGSFRNFPASNKKITNQAILICEFKDEKIIKTWLQSDRLGFLQEIGIVPAQPGIAAPQQK